MKTYISLLLFVNIKLCRSFCHIFIKNDRCLHHINHCFVNPSYNDNDNDTLYLHSDYDNEVHDNIKYNLSELYKDLFSFIMSENLLTRKTILNFPGFVANSHYKSDDITFINDQFPSKRKKHILYLAGVDMSAVSFYPYFLSIKEFYNIHTVITGLDCKLTFVEICSYIEMYLNNNLLVFEDLTIVGESFGALVAMHLVKKFEKYSSNVKLILINPASSYYKSKWPETFIHMKNKKKKNI